MEQHSTVRTGALRAALLSLGLCAALAAGPLWGCAGGGGGGDAGGTAGTGGTGAPASGIGGSGGAPSGSGSGTGTGGAPAAATNPFDAFATLRAQVAGLPTAEQNRRLDAFIATQADTAEGFPLRSGRRACFVRRSPAAQPFVAGGWNGWSATAAPLARIGASDVWFLEADLGAADRHEYKLVEGGAYKADPLNRKFTYGYRNSVANMSGSGKSHLERLAAVRSTALGNARDVVVYVPAGALDDATLRLPVLYMHDGQNVFDPTAMWGGWDAAATLDRLIAAPAGSGIRKVLVVAPENTADRMSEYTHVRDDISSSCNGSGATGGRAPLYARFLVDELKPQVDARWRTLTGRADTAILGSSLGGLVSLWTAFDRTSVFGMAGGMSSTLGWGDFCLGNDTVEEIAARRGKIDVKIYLDSGGAGPSAPSGDNWGPTEELKVLLESQGYVHGRDLQHWWTPGAQHNEAEWAARLEMPLRFFFGR